MASQMVHSCAQAYRSGVACCRLCLNCQVATPNMCSTGLSAWNMPFCHRSPFGHIPFTSFIDGKRSLHMGQRLWMNLLISLWKFCRSFRSDSGSCWSMIWFLSWRISFLLQVRLWFRSQFLLSRSLCCSAVSSALSYVYVLYLSFSLLLRFRSILHLWN
jgi:hypothetical protein